MLRNSRRAWPAGLNCLPALTAALLSTGCLDPALRCGNQAPSGACISILGLTPTSNAEKTANVDVVQGQCSDNSDPPKITDEPFRDHDVIITIVNQGVSAQDPPELGPAVVIGSYQITYSVNTPCDNGCPPLDPLEGQQTMTVIGGQQVEQTFPMMPIAKKLEFLDRGGDATRFPSYSAVYKLSGLDPVGKFSMEGAVSFTLGNFNMCPNQ